MPGDMGAVTTIGEAGGDMLEVGADHHPAPDRAGVHRVVVAMETDVVIPGQAQAGGPPQGRRGAGARRRPQRPDRGGRGQGARRGAPIRSSSPPARRWLGDSVTEDPVQRRQHVVYRGADELAYSVP